MLRLLLFVTVFVANSHEGSAWPDLDLNNPDTFWPPLTLKCHKYYDPKTQQTFPTAQMHCRNETSEQRQLLKQKVRITDWKTCVLWRIKGVVFEGKTPMWRSNQGLKKSLLTIMSGLEKLSDTETQERNGIVENLLTKSAPCAAVLDQMITKRLPTQKWDDFHNCVENAWKCVDPPPPPPPAATPPPPSSGETTLHPLWWLFGKDG